MKYVVIVLAVIGAVAVCYAIGKAIDLWEARRAQRKSGQRRDKGGGAT